MCVCESFSSGWVDKGVSEKVVSMNEREGVGVDWELTAVEIGIEFSTLQ